jgi:hypothetical protein
MVLCAHCGVTQCRTYFKTDNHVTALFDPFRPWQCTRRCDATFENHLAWQWLQKVSGGRNSSTVSGAMATPARLAPPTNKTIRDVPFLRCDVPYLRSCDGPFLKHDNICILAGSHELKRR